MCSEYIYAIFSNSDISKIYICIFYCIILYTIV